MKRTIGTTILATTLTIGLFATVPTVTNNELQNQPAPIENLEESINTTEKQNFFQKIEKLIKNAFADMKESAKALHEVDKANFEAVKAESKANFEENRFHNSLARVKEQAKESWEDAKMSPSERAEKMQEERDAQIKAAEERKAAAEERYEKAKKN